MYGLKFRSRCKLSKLTLLGIIFKHIFKKKIYWLKKWYAFSVNVRLGDYWMTLEYVGRYYVQYPRKLLYRKN
jgi:hypothetical protein